MITTFYDWKPRNLEVAISSLKPTDIRAIDELVDFDRGRGYVLDFSDRTFSEFFAAELDMDIYDPAFGEDGTSKGRISAASCGRWMMGSPSGHCRRCGHTGKSSSWTGI